MKRRIQNEKTYDAFGREIDERRSNRGYEDGTDIFKGMIRQRDNVLLLSAMNILWNHQNF